MFAIALDGDNVDGLRLVRVHLNDKPEVSGQVAADLLPGVAGVVTAHDVPVLLHEQDTRARFVHGNVMNAVTDLRVRVGDVLGAQAAVDRLPCLAAVIGAEGACGGDGNVDPARVLGIQDNGVQAHAPGAGLPFRTGAVAAQPGKFVPVFATISRAEQRRVFHSGVD